MKVHRLQINYKSGISMQADFEQFTIKGDVYSWITYGDRIPVDLGAENVESVWKLSTFEVEENK